jgi:hypothetical protein
MSLGLTFEAGKESGCTSTTCANGGEVQQATEWGGSWQAMIEH